MPWVRLKKSHVINTGKKLPIGKTMKFDLDYSRKLIDNGDAELYEGPLPPRKMKTDFFKPKK